MSLPVPTETAIDCPLSDDDLVKRTKEGDDEAFKDIVSRHRGKVFGVALSYLKLPADAEEAVQEIFIKVYRNLPGFKGDSAFSTWLHKIAVNHSRNRYWYFVRRKRQSTFSIEQPIPESDGVVVEDVLHAGELSPAMVIELDEIASAIESCLATLNENHRTILTLWYSKRLPQSEISDLLQIKGGTVKSRINRARIELRKRLSEMYPNLVDQKALAAYL